MTNHGGARRGAGRKPGRDWDGTGEYERTARVRKNYRVSPENMRWVISYAEDNGKSQSDIVNKAIETLREIAEGG